ncbi:hypothetical protein ES703_111804 [subsurface metagenome]
MKKKLFKFSATFIVAFIIYLLLAGPLNGQEALLGLMVALASSLLMVGHLPFDMRVLNPVRIAKALSCLPFLLRNMIRAGLNIASLVIRPALNINPSLAKGKTSLSSASGKLLLTSIITLMPGTLSVDIRKKTVHVHCLKAENTGQGDTGAEILEPVEKQIRGITE